MKTPEEMAEEFVESDFAKKHRLNFAIMKTENCGPFRGYFRHVGNTMVLEVGMVGKMMVGIDYEQARRKIDDINDVRNRPYHKLKVAMKRQMLQHIDALFGDLESKHNWGDDGILYDGDDSPHNKVHKLKQS